jgi:hypothetical protein
MKPMCVQANNFLHTEHLAFLSFSKEFLNQKRNCKGKNHCSRETVSLIGNAPLTIVEKVREPEYKAGLVELRMPF